MIQYMVRIVSAWALLRLASFVMKDAEKLLQASVTHKDKVQAES